MLPLLQGGRDALVNAPTGSGKTLAYLAPIVHDLAAASPLPLHRSSGTHAIVVCPTRELCLQVADVLAMLVKRFVWLVSEWMSGVWVTAFPVALRRRYTLHANLSPCSVF